MRRSIILILFVVLCSQAMGQAVEDAAPAAPGGPVPTAAQPKDMTSLEVVERVERFFDRSWNRLLITLFIVGGFVSALALGVPWYLDYLRKKQLTLQEEKILDRIENARTEASERIAGITTDFEKKLTEQIASVRTEALDEVRHSVGALWSELGHRSRMDYGKSGDPGHLHTAVLLFFLALQQVRLRSDPLGRPTGLYPLVNLCEKSRNELKALLLRDDWLRSSLRETLEKIEKKPAADVYAEDFATLKKFLDECDEAAKEPGDSEPSGGSESEPS